MTKWLGGPGRAARTLANAAYIGAFFVGGSIPMISLSYGAGAPLAGLGTNPIVWLFGVGGLLAVLYGLLRQPSGKT